MAFRISEMNTEKPKRIWMPVDATDTLYVGQIVYSTSDGVAPLGTADGPNGADDTKMPLGVIVGTNYRTPVYDSTYKTNKITGVAASGSQDDLEKVGGHGAHMSVGDSQAKVEVAIITPSTVLEGPIYNAAYGTAPTVLTVTVASSDGCITAPTTGAADFTPVADLATLYFRTGGNAGAYRITTDTSTTQPTVTHGFPNATVAVGDTCVRVPLRMGLSRAQFDSESMYIDCSAALTADYRDIIVVALDLAESGREKCHFMFSVDSFAAYARSNT